MPPDSLHDAVVLLQSDVHTIKGSLSMNTAATEKLARQSDEIQRKLDKNETDMDELLQLFRDGRGAARMVIRFGDIAKWLAILGAAFIGLWVAVKGGGGGGNL